MPSYRHKVTTGLAAQTRYRVDTASGSDTPATITSPNEGNPITGAIVRSDYNGGGVEFTGAADTYYLKPLKADGTLVGSGTVTVNTPRTIDDPNPTPQVGVATAAGQSGAVTIDLSKGPVQVLTLTGNVTSWTFSNPGRSGQEVQVHFVQDATGSRTITGANAAIKLAAGALTLTTTAAKRDVLTFRQIAGVFHETARALNV